MTIRVRTFCFAAVMILSLAGCSDRNEADNSKAEAQSSSKSEPQVPVAEPDGDCLMSELPMGAVFLRVNGQAFTRRDFEARSRMYDFINRTRARDLLVGPNAEAERALAVMAPAIVSDMKRRELLRQFAEKNNVTPTPEDIGEVSTNLLLHLRRADSTIDAVADEFGAEQGKLLRAYVMGDATDIALRRFMDKDNILTVTEEDVIAASNRFEKFTAQAIASNAVEKAMLETAIQEITEGADFAEVARRYSERPEDALDWGELDSDDLGDEPALAEWLRKAKPGDLSAIMEQDDGWSVFKLVSVERDDEDPEDATWKLVRICRTLWEQPQELDHDETVEGILEYRTKKIQRLVGDRAMENAVVEWPHGTNLFKRVTGQTDQIPQKSVMR